VTIDEYRELVKRVSDAQGELNQAVYQDLQRLASAESENTKNKVREAYVRGAEEIWEAVKLMRTMSPDEFSDFTGPGINDIYGVAAADVINLYNAYKAEKKAEAEKREIHVGDEIYFYGKFGIVLVIEDGECSVMFPDRAYAMRTKVSELAKTGRNFKDARMIADAIKALRKEME